MFFNSYGNYHYNYYNGNQSQPTAPVSYFNRRPSEEYEIDLAELFRAIRRKGLLIIATTLAVAIPSSVWILSQPPLYEGKVEILVEPPYKNRTSLSFLQQIHGINFSSESLNYEGQLGVLKSQLTLAPIVESIRSKYPEISLSVSKNGKKTENLADALDVKQRAGAKDKEAPIIEVTYKNKSREKVLFVLEKIASGYIQYNKQQQVRQLTQAIKFVEGEIKRVREEVYQWESELEKFQKSRGLILEPTRQADALKEQLTFLRQQREAVKLELGGLRKLFRLLQNQLQFTPQQVTVVTRLNEQPNYLKLVSQIKDTETQIALETLRFGPQNPTVRALTDKRNQLVSLLQMETGKILKNPSENPSLDFIASMPQQNLEKIQQFLDTYNQIQVLQAKDRGLEEALVTLNKNIDSLSTENKQYNRIVRELQIANESLTRLLSVRENLQIQVAQELSPWQLLTPINENIIKDVSKKNLKLAAAVVASVFLSLFVGLLAEALDTKFRSLEEIKNTIRLPLLGTCPYNKNLAVLFPGNHKKARKKGLISPQTLSEAFNLTLDSYCHLYTNISLLSADKPINSIVISATFSQEGKTSTAVGLAKAAAMMGKKVLLVDTDMRAPSVQSYFGLDNQTGLSQLVTDNITLEEVIKSCPQQENLFVITAGTMPPNPIPLLASNKWHSFMEQFYQQFDFVIYDSPPLTVFPDAKTIAPQTDGLV
ncbi:MAG: polysaccharide biosynthesis tyrosine autokinase, partial [Geminocystis sp.]|nr:polysaccharide biosynthesis tyrosine autokinase [Geminocystis sp.]